MDEKFDKKWKPLEVKLMEKNLCPNFLKKVVMFVDPDGIVRCNRKIHREQPSCELERYV